MKFSVIILAGGLSSRMGSDKAFLQIGERRFLEQVVSEVANLSEDIIIPIGMKNIKRYRELVQNESVRLLQDETYIQSPLGGILTGLMNANETYAAVLACDSPFIKSSLVSHLFSRALTHDAAVPLWSLQDKMSTEPLCAVYKVESTRVVIKKMLNERKIACRRMILELPDVEYIPVSELRGIDERLDSFRNINTKEEYDKLLAELDRPRYTQEFLLNGGQVAAL